jgi:hypothetical protein
VVASLLVGPVTLLIALGLWEYAGGAPMMQERVVQVVCTLVISGAVLHEFTAVSRRSFVGQARSQENDLLGAYDAIAAYAHQAGWQRIVLAVDRTAEFLTPQNISIRTYEHSGVWLPPSYTLGGSTEGLTPERARAGIAAADFAILAGKPDTEASSPYPFDQQMMGLTAQLRSEATLTMTPLRTVEYAGQSFTVFAKPAVRVSGGSGQWLTADGATLRMPCDLLAGKHALIASGRTIFHEMLNNALGVTAVLHAGDAAYPLGMSTVTVTDQYSLRFPLPHADARVSGMCAVVLGFDRFFVPKERGINQDARRLVILAPTTFRFE